MKCVILAAGYATRLYPLTENFPKPLLEINGKSILDWLVDDIYESCGITSFIVVSNHKYVEYFHKWKATKNFEISILDDGSTSNETRIGAVKDIQFAIDSLHLDEDLLVIAGDNVLDFSFSTFVEFFKQKKTSCIMKYYEKTLLKDHKYCVTEVDAQDKVLYMKEKIENPTSHFLVPPFYAYRKEDLPLVKQSLINGCPFDTPGSLVEWMCKSTAFHAMSMPGKRFDVGTIEGYRTICNNYSGITNGR